MNTSIISHRMFVAALTNNGHAPEKQLPVARNAEAAGSIKNRPARPTPKTIATLAARPWVSWPFGGWEEHSAS